jgi:RNA polymerase sigma-54 factor
MRGEQHMLLLPQLLQSIELLQMPTLELDAFLREAAEENEALLLEEGREDTDWSRPRSWEDSAAHDELLQNQPARPRSATELVLEQLASVEIEDELLPWVRHLVGNLDASGYLSGSDEELLASARDAGLTGDEGTLGRAIGVLQRLEPRGIGARDAVEALLLQLDPGDPDYASLCRLLEEFLDELARNKLPRVARAMDLSLEELARLIEILRTLEPRPLADLAAPLEPPIEPDLVVESIDGEWQVRLARTHNACVRVDPAIRIQAADRSQPREVRRWLRGRIGAARWIVRAVEQRRATLLRVAAAVFGRQAAFLENGPGHLTPLRMGEIAASLAIHVSTVSRAVAGKHVQTPWGVIPLRTFFPLGAGPEDSLARDDVRERVRALIAAEDAKRPKSDDELCAELAAEGLEVARRTVAKYRTELGIQSSYRRRRYA